MLKHWSETDFGDFILQQECKMMRQAMLVSVAQTITIVFDADAADSGVRERFSQLAEVVRNQSSRPLQLRFAEISDEASNIDSHSVNVRPEYLTHLIDSETGEHLESDSSDWVILSHAVESTQQPRQLLREATRVLAEGGRLTVFAFSPVHYLERALWRTLSKTRPSVKTELSRWRLHDWLKVLSYEVTQANSLIAPLRSLSNKFREQQLEQEHVRTSPWIGMVYQVDALKHDIPMTPMRMTINKKKKLSLRLVSSAQGKVNKNSVRTDLQLVPVRNYPNKNHPKNSK